MREKKEINIQIGERIKAAREKANLTQEQLSEQIEVSPQYISDLERGVVGIAIPTLKRLCVALSVSSDELLFGANAGNTVVIVEKIKSLSAFHYATLCVIIDKYIDAVSALDKS